MTFRRICTFVFLLIVVSAFAETARAAEISVFGGIKLPGSVRDGGEKTPLGNSPAFGLRLGYDFVPYFGMEHTLAHSPNYLFPSTNSADKAKGFIYNSNLMLGFPNWDQIMIPFLTAGIGLIHQYGDKNLPVGTMFAFNYGGGIKAPHLAGPFGVRIDLRGYRAGVFSKKMDIAEISIGLMISLGR